MAYIRWILLAAVLLPIWLLVTAPATLVAKAASAGGLQLSGLNGSLWAGSAESARLQLAPVKGRALVFDLGELDWQLEPMSLLGLNACGRVSASLSSQQFQARLCTGPGGTTRVSDLRLNAPASYLRLVAPIDANGQLMLAVDELSLAGNRLQSLSGGGRVEGLSLLMGRDWQSFGNLNLNLGVAGDKSPVYTADLISDDNSIQWFASAPEVVFTNAGPAMLLSTQLQLSESYRLQWGNMLGMAGFEERDGGYVMDVKLP